VKKQNTYSLLRLVVPAFIATTIIIDLTNKRPAPYVEVPLLTNNNNNSNTTSNGNAGINVICKF
jgi:hypothetical protein